VNRIRKTMGLVLLSCCLLLGCFAGIRALVDTARQGSSFSPQLWPVEQSAARVPDQSGLELNSSTREELITLPGIGEYLAEQIILQREVHPFYDLEDLLAVKGIGKGKIDALRGLAYVQRPD
jgi:DNA uptake protein ComE-like DNA-binding protein